MISNMVNKRHWHHVWRYLRKVHPVYFVVLTLVFGTMSVFALRSNNQHMIQLRNAVYEADKSNGDVEAALRDLRQYVYAHMNTGLTSGPNAVHPPIQLQYTYQRLQAERAAKETNKDVYSQAQAYCQQQNPTDFSGRNRIPCIEQYVLSHGTALTPIPDALYKFDFVAAKWSFDLAGWSIVAAVFSALFAVVLTIYRIWAKANL